MDSLKTFCTRMEVLQEWKWYACLILDLGQLLIFLPLELQVFEDYNRQHTITSRLYTYRL